MRKVWRIGLTVALALFLGVWQATAATLCVEPTGAMGCFNTVQGAVGAAAPGDHIWVAPGVYYENVVVTTPNITIQGGVYTAARMRGRGALAPSWTPADPTQVIIDARPLPDCSGTGPAIWINGADNVTVANLTVRHADYGGPSGVGDNIYSTGNVTILDTVHSLSSWDDGVDIEANNALVRNCRFAANFNTGVEIDGDNAQVINNVIYQHSDGGIYISGLSPVVTGNHIDASEDDDGIELFYANNALVSNNVIRGADGTGIYISQSDNCRVTNNDIRSCDDAGIYLYYCDVATISGNYISGVNDEGIYVSYNTAGQNVIRNNTVERVRGSGIRVDDLNTTITGNTVRNVANSNGIDVESDGGAISNNLVEGVARAEGWYLGVDNATVSNNVARFNATEGFYIFGDNNVISSNKAWHNGNGWQGGFDIGGTNNTISGNLAEMNPGYGFYIAGDNTVTGNTAANNYRTGIYLAQTYGGLLLVDGNLATNNHGEGIANFAIGTCDIINNTALGNRTDICDEGPADLFQNNTFVTGGWNQACCLE